MTGEKELVQRTTVEKIALPKKWFWSRQEYDYRVVPTSRPWASIEGECMSAIFEDDDKLFEMRKENAIQNGINPHCGRKLTNCSEGMGHAHMDMDDIDN